MRRTTEDEENIAPNAHLARQLGYTLDELFAPPLTDERWTALVHPDDRAAARKVLQRHLAGEIEGLETTVRLRHRDGSWVWVLTRGKLMT